MQPEHFMVLMLILTSTSKPIWTVETELRPPPRNLFRYADQQDSHIQAEHSSSSEEEDTDSSENEPDGELIPVEDEPELIPVVNSSIPPEAGGPDAGHDA
ncbi:hypothetical protein LWI29_036167 [Acer saccharum]|uniref:Secreted protein n=1 Tax=Acer saccharum TaxID=4024 RepID=A0AA39SG08_ACESA|nr:hypothetical protein LWI29_036167 [Acer saccharum]